MSARPPSPAADPPSWPTLEPRDFARLAAFIEQRFGIRMPLAKKALLEARLGKRLRELGMAKFRAYCDRVLSGDPEELLLFADRVTTNKTDFFREPQHFEVLVEEVLPALIRMHGAGVRRDLAVWSAGCSTGEEPYTLAMVLAAARVRHPALRFRILASDLSTRVLRMAQGATYGESQVEPIPLELRRRYLLRQVKDPDVVRVRRSLRETVTFRRLNLLDRDYGPRHSQDVVFCRNVLIYFERRLQLEVLRRLAEVLVPGGFLFLGHSESISGLDVPFDVLAPTVYRTRCGRRPAGGGR